MTYKVHNLQEGNRPVPAGYSSWLNYWERKVGHAAGNCHKRPNTCQNDATDGAHVQLDASYGNNNWYIVPLCHLHNLQRGETFWVEGPLVPVDSRNSILW